MGPEFASHRSTTSAGFTHAKRSLVPKEILMLVVTCQSLLKTSGDPVYSSADPRFRRWEDVVWDSFACNYEDHPVTRRDESDITAVELTALVRELAVDPLRWFDDFVMEKTLAFFGCRIPAVARADANLVHRWLDDQLNLGGVAALEELARQIQSYVHACSDPDNVSWADSYFFLGRDELETP